MANCQFCNDPVSLPYTCSLCQDRYCGNHRLPESHECLYIGTYTTPEYASVKRQKSREVQSIKAGVNPDTGNRYISGGATGTSRFGTQSFWEAGSVMETTFFGGMILGLAAILGLLLLGPYDLYVRLLISFFVIAIGGIGFVIILQSRRQKASQVGVYTSFVIWPIGIAITLITSLIGFTFYTFGFFTNSGSSIQSEAEVAKRSIYTFASLAIGLRILASVSAILLPTSNFVIFSFSFALFRSALMFAWYGLIMMLPFSILDGAKLYNSDSRSFWLHLLGMIAVIVIVNSNFF